MNGIAKLRKYACELGVTGTIVQILSGPRSCNYYLEEWPGDPAVFLGDSVAEAAKTLDSMAVITP